MLKPNHITVLFAIWSLHQVSGYKPTIGEVSKVAGLSYGVTYRACETLCAMAMIESQVQLTKKIGYRFKPAPLGIQRLEERGWK